MKTLRVAIGVSSGELGRYGIFWDSLLHVKGVTSENVICGRGANIAENRNGLAQRAIGLGFHALWYVDDDQVFPPDTLQKLVNRDKDIVSGLYLKRETPFIPHVYRKETAGWKPNLLTKGSKGLVKADAVGAGCLLVNLDVFRKLEKPWWRLGQMDRVNWSDDTEFCLRAKEAGFEIWCDLDAPVGHQMNGTLWPVCQPDGDWNTSLVVGQNAISVWPAAQEKP